MKSRKAGCLLAGLLLVLGCAMADAEVLLGGWWDAGAEVLSGADRQLRSRLQGEAADWQAVEGVLGEGWWTAGDEELKLACEQVENHLASLQQTTAAGGEGQPLSLEDMQQAAPAEMSVPEIPQVPQAVESPDGGQAPADALLPEDAGTPEAMESPVPEITPVPTSTLLPTATPVPTPTPLPTATPKPIPGMDPVATDEPVVPLDPLATPTPVVTAKPEEPSIGRRLLLTGTEQAKLWFTGQIRQRLNGEVLLGVELVNEGRSAVEAELTGLWINDVSVSAELWIKAEGQDRAMGTVVANLQPGTGITRLSFEAVLRKPKGLFEREGALLTEPVRVDTGNP